MKGSFSIIVFLTLVIQIPAQEISRHEADSLLRVLNKTKPGAERIELLLRVAQFHILKLGENKIDFDSADIYINEAERLNRSVKSASLAGYLLLTEAIMVKEKGQRDSAKQMVEKAITILQTSGNKYYLAKAYYELSNHYDYRDTKHLPDKIGLVEKALDQYQQLGDMEEKANCLKMLGDLYIINDDFKKGTTILLQALAICDSIHCKQLTGIYVLLASIYIYQNDYKQAMQYELQALKTAEERRDTSMQMCQITSDLAGLYSHMARYDISLKYYKEAMRTAIKYNDHFAVTLTVFNISKCFNYLGQQQQELDFLATIPEEFLHPSGNLEKAFVSMAYVDAYLGTRQYTKAEPYCNLLMGLVDGPDIPANFRNFIYRLVATYYLATRQFEKARFYMTKNAPLTKQLGVPKWTSLDERVWYKLDSAQGDFRSAFSHLLTFKTISDSILNETKTLQFEQLEVEYETAKKADSIKLQDQHISLLTQKNNLQKANLKQAHLIRNITIAGIILAIIIIGLLYRQYRHKQQSNKIISHKNELLQHLVTEKEWLLKEVHHRVKNNLHTVIALLESQAAYLEDDALKANEVSKHRIYTMSLIHQQLYKARDLKTIDMSVYLPELLDYLGESFETARDIRFKLDIEPLKLGVSQAIPVALIVNEAVTNSIKYAFPPGKPGIISITMNQIESKIKLVISDNGIGIDPAIMKGESTSLGLKLMNGLSEDIDGEIDFINENGTKIVLRFSPDLLHEPTDLPVV